MQAIFFFALFGLVLAILGSIVGTVTQSSMAIQTQMVEDTKRYMSDVKDVIVNRLTLQDVRTPNPTPASDIFNEPEILQQVTWMWGTPDEDPWGNTFQVYIATEDHPIRAAVKSGGTIAVSPVATAYLLASAGPDGTLQTNVSSINSGDIESIMRISAATDSDDIIYTFNTRTALEKRWEMVESQLDELDKVVAFQYTQVAKEASFTSSLEQYFNEVITADSASGTEVSGFYDGSGNFEIITDCPGMSACVDTSSIPYTTDAACVAALSCDSFSSTTVLDDWKDPATSSVSADTSNALSAAVPDMANYAAIATDTNFLAVQNLTQPITGFTLTATAVQTVGTGTNDVLRITLTPQAGSNVWRSSGGTFSYHYDIGGDNQ